MSLESHDEVMEAVAGGCLTIIAAVLVGSFALAWFIALPTIGLLWVLGWLA